MRSAMIKYLRKLTSFLFILQHSYASTPDQLLGKYPELGQDNVSIQILEASTGKSIYSKNPNLALNPASSLKILVSSAAFDSLGLGHAFKTWVKKSDQSLCLIGGGDPSLVEESLKQLAKITQQFLSLSSESFSELIVDESLFPWEKPFDQSFAGDEDRAFTADIGSLSVNFNSVAVRVKPGKLGQAASVLIIPDVPEIKVKNRTITTASGGKKDIGVSIQAAPGTKEYVVTVFGNVSAKQNYFTLYSSIPSEPAMMAGYIFREELKKNGIHIPVVSKKTCPKTATDVFSWDSKPLSNIVQDMNIYSNNFIAEMLLRNIGEANHKTSGLGKINRFLATINAAAPSTILDNASGLSRHNRISADTLAKTFRASMNSSSFGPEFLASMSINGRTGTMRNRIKDDSVIRAKSGTLRGVVSLVGRATTDTKDYVFSFVFNTSKYSTSELQSLENSVLKSLLEIR